ncbi:flagellin, partial [bacterium]|nr:flagellin [bacterium]
GATKEIMSMLGRMRELAVQAASGTYNQADRAALDLEFGALMDEITRISEDTEWNGEAILSGASPATVDPTSKSALSKTIQIGAGNAQNVELKINSWQPKVALDSDASYSNGTVTNANGADPKVGVREWIAFSDMGSNQSITLAGVTITTDSDDSLTGYQLAAYFTQLTDGGSLGSITGTGNSTVSGSFNGYDTLSGYGPPRVVFINSGRSNSSKTLEITADSGNILTYLGPNLLEYGTENQGAYGGGGLYFGSTPGTRIDIKHQNHAMQVVTELEYAINGGSAERAKYGSYMALLQHASNNLNNAATNASASLSQIADTDYALATTELARAQIISQASTAMLAQANQSKQTVLELLR